MSLATNTILQMSDKHVIAEASRRLANIYRKDTGQKFMYGFFKLLFHDGRLTKVEEWSRCNRFQELAANNLTESV